MWKTTGKWHFISQLKFWQSWTKVLGQIYICGAFWHKFIYTCSATPPPTMLDICTRYFSRQTEFQHCIGGRGGKQRILKCITGLCLKLRFKNTENQRNYASVPRNFVHHCRMTPFPFQLFRVNKPEAVFYFHLSAILILQMQFMKLRMTIYRRKKLTHLIYYADTHERGHAGLADTFDQIFWNSEDFYGF